MAELTYRSAVARAIAQEMRRDPSVVFLGEDVGDAGGVFKATEGLLEQFDGEDYDTALTPAALELLRQAFTPSRYLAHGLQMLASYVAQLAPASRITNCAAFQAADEVRRLQRIAYRTAQLAARHAEINTDHHRRTPPRHHPAHAARESEPGPSPARQGRRRRSRRARLRVGRRRHRRRRPAGHPECSRDPGPPRQLDKRD